MTTRQSRYLQLGATLAMGLVSASTYPIIKAHEWTAIEDNGNGWGMDGNFYVITEYEDAPLKFGIALGIRPNHGEWFQEEGIYQMFIQFEQDAIPEKEKDEDDITQQSNSLYFSNVVCDLTFDQFVDDQNVKFTNSCGYRDISELELITFEELVGEQLICENPWMVGLDMTGFMLAQPTDGGVDEDRPYITCSFFRYLNTPNMAEVKVGDGIRYKSGFKYFQNELSATPVQLGTTEKLYWTITDSSSNLMVAFSSLILCAALF